MSAFSRGLGLALSHRIFSFAPKTASPSHAQQSALRMTQSIRNSPIIQAARNLQTSARLRAVQQSAKPTPSSLRSATSRTTRTPPPTSPGAPLSVAARLANRGKPTIIYESASHFWLHLSALLAATFCITYAVLNYWNRILHPPEGLAWWVPHGFAVICLCMAAMGSFFLLGTSFLLRRITAVPKNLLPPSYLQGGKGSKSPAELRSLELLKSSPVALEITMSSIIPFLPAKKIIAAPSEVWLPFKIQNAPLIRNFEQQINASGTSGVATKALAPFEKLGSAFRNMTNGFKRGLTREGFAPIKIKGVRYKIDIINCKVLDNGRVMDYLVGLRPEIFNDGWWTKLLK